MFLSVYGSSTYPTHTSRCISSTSSFGAVAGRGRVGVLGDVLPRHLHYRPDCGVESVERRCGRTLTGPDLGSTPRPVRLTGQGRAIGVPVCTVCTAADGDGVSRGTLEICHPVGPVDPLLVPLVGIGMPACEQQSAVLGG